jgi:hypothetical protein
VDHERAVSHVAELAAGRLEPALAAEVRAHVAACETCRGVLRAAEAVHLEVREHGAALFGDHPAPEAIARFALEPGALGVAERAGLAAHVRACPRCAGEASQARAAAATAWMRAPRAWWVGARGPAPWLAPALGALALVLAWPAWQGLVEMPRLEARLAREAQARREAERARVPQVAPAPPGGAARSLVLSEASRSGGAPAASVALAPGQGMVPVLMDLDLSGEPPGRAVRASVRRVGGTEVWALESTAGEVWDARARVIGLLVPASALAPGEHELRLAWRPGGEFFRAAFRVEAPESP